jgi:glycosyltransferase involved in cell wall biosynthesis
MGTPMRNDKEKTNVLILESYPRIGGAEVCLLSFLKKIDRSQFQVTVVAPQEGPLAEELKRLGFDVEVVPVRGLKTLNPFRFAKNLFHFFKAIQAVTNIVHQRKIDLVHAWLYRGFGLASLIHQKNKVPCLGSLFDALNSAGISWLRKKITVFCANRYLEMVIAASDAIKNIAVKEGIKSEKLRTVYAGIDCQEFLQKVNPAIDLRKNLGLEREALVIGSVGQFHKWKGQNYLIHAIRALKKDFPLIKCILVGGVLMPFKDHIQYESELKSLPKKLAIEENIIFLGWREDTASLMNNFDIFVVPSTFPDPFPNVILEAMCLAKPIIASRVGGIPEMIQDGVSGGLVEPRDSQRLAEMIGWLLRDQNKRKELGENAFQTVQERFPVERNVRGITDIYKTLVS